MNQNKLIISPKTKVGELLDPYPELENVLMELSPAFGKLKNPVLRKTVARVASLQQAAVVGGLMVEELVNRLRKEVGQEGFAENTENSGYLLTSPPGWFDTKRVNRWFDATSIINSGGSPMAEILTIANKLLPGEILELKTPFVPAPIIDILKNKGFSTFSMQKGGNVLSYFKTNFN